MSDSKISKLPNKISTLDDIRKLEAKGMQCEQALNRGMGRKTLSRKLDPTQRYKHHYFENENGKGGWACAQKLKTIAKADTPKKKVNVSEEKEIIVPKKPTTAGERVARIVRQFPKDEQTLIREDVRGMASSGKTPREIFKSLAMSLHHKAMKIYATVAVNNKLNVGDAQLENASSEILGWIVKGENIDSITFKINQLVQIQKGDVDLNVNDLKKSHFNDSANDKLNRANDIDN